MELAVSVIVPVYKVESTLEKCVDSLLKQSYPNLEILLVDDGSPDRCPEICDRCAAEHENVRVLHKPNGGLSDARNYGVRHTDRDWIAFVDSDDYVEPAYVADMVALRDRYDAQLAITHTAREREDGSGKPAYTPFESFQADAETALYEVYAGGKVGWAAYGKLYHRELLLANPFPAGYYEDCACMYRIICGADRIAIGDCGSNYHYIQRRGSILGSELKEEHLRIFDICGEFDSFLEDRYPELGILSVSFRRRAVTQLLNLQRMPWRTYKEIFMRYRADFRRNLRACLAEKNMSRKAKLYTLLLCGRPELYWLLEKLYSSMK